MEIIQSTGAWIPSFILDDNTLNSDEKILYAKIVSLSEKRGYCWASNKWLAEYMGISERSVSRKIKKLQGHGLISVDMEKTHTGTQRVLKLDHHIVGGGVAKLSIPVSPKTGGGIDKNGKTLYIVDEKRDEKKEYIQELHECVNELRVKYGHEVISLTPSRIKLYKKLLKLYNLNDLKEVANFRFEQLNSPDFRHYQVPETVFRLQKIEGALAAARSRQSGDKELYRLY